VTGIECGRAMGRELVSYLQARRDRAASWALRWAFRPRGGGERRHLWVRTLRKEEKRERANGKADNRVEIKYAKGLHNRTGHASLTVPLPSPSQTLNPGAYITHLYVHASYPIYPTGPNTSPFHIFSLNYLRYHPCHFYKTRHPLSVNTINASFSVIPSGSSVKLSDVSMQGTWPAAALVSPSIDNFIITSVCHRFQWHYSLKFACK
jgi:hypothetical protein